MNRGAINKHNKMDTFQVKLNHSTNLYYRITKLIIDLVFAVIGILIMFPIIFMFAVLIVMESPGSPFYVQERLGLNGKRFKIFKLRSMRCDAEKNGAQWAEKNDPRITKVGMFIRKTRIDEIPQFINILKGDMSVVGPRPERPLFTEKFEKEIPGFKNRLLVKPGITGWAQVNGGYEITPKEKLELDVEYINQASITLDIRIIIKTIIIVVTGNGAR